MTEQMDGQMSLFDQDTWFSKTYPDSSPQTKGKTSKQSSRKSQGSQTPMQMMCLCLKMDDGNTQDTSTHWENGNFQSLGGCTIVSGGEFLNAEDGLLWLPISTDSQPDRLCLTLNIGEKPREIQHTKLSDLLETKTDPKYDLSAKACLGILNRARKRGKPLPKELENALIAQSLSKNVPENQGGGKGLLIQKDPVGALSTRNIQRVLTPRVFESHDQDSRYNEFHDVCETVNAKYGTGGGNAPMVVSRE